MDTNAVVTGFLPGDVVRIESRGRSSEPAILSKIHPPGNAEVLLDPNIVVFTPLHTLREVRFANY